MLEVGDLKTIISARVVISCSSNKSPEVLTSTSNHRKSFIKSNSTAVMEWDRLYGIVYSDGITVTMPSTNGY
jgi:hypothetical protein